TSVELYSEVPIPLDHKDPYTVLIAVLLSAQCTYVRVNQITPKLCAFPGNPYDMAKLRVEEIEEFSRRCVVSTMKSKDIFGLSKILIQQYYGEVPADISILETLPAVGHKTASVLMSQAFNIPAFPVDTHIHRLMHRWNLSSGKNVQQTEKDAKRLFPENKWNKLHLQMIWYGREYSPARGWKFNNDIITRAIGTKAMINELLKTHKQ